MPVVSFLALAFAAASLAWLGWASWRLARVKPADLAWRGIIKLAATENRAAELGSIYATWFRAFWTFYAVGCVAAAVLVWATDHSFLVVIFPLFFYYFFVRFFMWEKHDLAD